MINLSQKEISAILIISGIVLFMLLSYKFWNFILPGWKPNINNDRNLVENNGDFERFMGVMLLSMITTFLIVGFLIYCFL